MTGQVLMRFAGGKVVEGWTNMDDLGLREQLGATGWRRHSRQRPD